MQYLLMIYSNEAEYAKIDPATSKKIMGEYEAFTKDIVQSGNFKAGDGLQPTTTATTVRVREGKTLTTDGPFVGMKEAVGGFFVLEADDLDAAIEVAARVPAARLGGAIEIRPSEAYWQK